MPAQVNVQEIEKFYVDIITGIVRKTRKALPRVLDQAFENILVDAQPVILDYYNVYLSSLKIAQEHVHLNSHSLTSLNKCTQYLRELERMKLKCDTFSTAVCKLDSAI